MAVHTIRKGLDIPISGAPDQRIHAGPTVGAAGLIADDYVGLKPTMLVKLGDVVRRGQPLMEDKKAPGVIYTSPGAGTVRAINRGEKRSLQSVVIDLNDRERAGSPSKDDLVEFSRSSGKGPAGLSSDEVRALLVESGLWTAFRTRPFSKVPRSDAKPDAVFINAMDTNPLGPSMDVIYQGNEEAFAVGCTCIAKLREGHIYLCRAPGSVIAPPPHSGIQVEEFSGPHPAGTAGVHIHILEGVSREHVAWHVGLQDVIAIGKLFMTGRLEVDRIISLAGPSVKQPRLLRTRLGASIDDLVKGGLHEGEQRVISGSVLSGRQASGPVFGFLGRYHQQVSVVREGREREFFGWLMPGMNKFSTVRVYASALSRGKRFEMTTSTNGSERAMVPIGTYEQVMPMDILPTFLLRALIIGDVERAEQLGCLELDEEDLALCTFVCPGKYEYGPYLREILTRIEKEG